MARRVLRVERGGKVLASWALDGDPIELTLVDEGAGVSICAWRLAAEPDRRVDEPSLQRLLRAEDDDLTMPLPEPTETTGGALPETEEAPARPRAAKRPVPNLARTPARVPTGLPSLGLGPAREPERELTLPPPEPFGAERELTLPEPEPHEPSVSVSLSSLSLPLPTLEAARPPLLGGGLAARPLAGGRGPAPAGPRPRPPTGAPPKPPAAQPQRADPRPPLDPSASASRPAPPRASAPVPAPGPVPAPAPPPVAPAGRPADEEESFTAAALPAEVAAVALSDFDLGEEIAEAPAPKPAEVWVRRRSEWRAGGQLSPGQRAVARGGWVRFGEDGVLMVDPGPSLEGSATLLDGAVVELAPGSGPRRLSPGASVLLREGDYGLYVRAEAPADGG